MTAKEAVADILREAPENATFEEIMYQIYVREKIEVGLKDVEQGNIVSPEQVEARLSRWDIK